MAEVKADGVTGLEEQSAPALGAWVGASLDWWREAGIDVDFTDEPIDWLARAGASEAATPVAASLAEHPSPAAVGRPDPRSRAGSTPDLPALGGDRGTWPCTLDQFAGWWMTEPSLAMASGPVRVAPVGERDAALMVLVPMPEADDGDVLLSGREGRLLDALLRTMGLARGEVYLASALPSRIALPDWHALNGAGLGELTMHHVALVRPKKLLILGRTDISSLIPHDPANNAAILPSVNQERASVPVALEYALATLLAQPSLKRRVWLNWLDWTGTGLQ